MKNFLLSGIFTLIIILSACGNEEPEAATDEEIEFGQANETTEDSQQDLDTTEEETDSIHDIDKSEFEELDPTLLSNNEYEKQTKLKYSDAEVAAIIPDDEIGNEIVASNTGGEAEDDKAAAILIHDATQFSDIEEGGTYTFYGVPDGNNRLILFTID